jgi:hypothetical protein
MWPQVVLLAAACNLAGDAVLCLRPAWVGLPGLPPIVAAAAATSAALALSCALMLRALNRVGLLRCPPPLPSGVSGGSGEATGRLQLAVRAAAAPPSKRVFGQLCEYAAPLLVIVSTRVLGFVAMSVAAAASGQDALAAHQVKKTRCLF